MHLHYIYPVYILYIKIYKVYIKYVVLYVCVKSCGPSKISLTYSFVCDFSELDVRDSLYMV